MAKSTGALVITLVGAVIFMVLNSLHIVKSVGFEKTDDSLGIAPVELVPSPRTTKHTSPPPNTINNETRTAIDTNSSKIKSQDSSSTSETPAADNVTQNSTVWPPNIHHLTDDRNCIITLIVNCAYMDMADNLIGSLLRLNITNFVLIPLDDTTHVTLKQIYPDRVVPIMPGIPRITESVEFGSEAFKALTASRANILHKFLEQGYTVFYCDLDTVWKKNALDFVVHETEPRGYELAVVKDHNEHTVCSCFLYMKPNPKNLHLLETWNDEIQSGRHAQDQPAFQAALRLLSQQLEYLLIPPKSPFLPSGRFYFKLWNDTLREPVVIVHNNYIRGHAAKVERFTDFGLWHPTGNLDKVNYTCSGATSRRRLDAMCSPWLLEDTTATGRMIL